MKLCICTMIFLTISLASFSQSIPQNLNVTDATGLRQGTWTITFNAARQITQNKDSVAYYRIVIYKNDKPTGVVRDYYLSGQIQWEGGLLADRPQDVHNGLTTWYHVDGSKEVVRVFENGKQISEVSFNLDGSEAIVNWDSLNRLGEESYFSGEYEKSLQYFEQAVIQAEKEFGAYHLNYALALNNLGILTSSYKHNYVKAEILYRQALSIYEKVGKEHPDYGTSLDNLAFLYHDQGNYRKAELLYQQAISVKEKTLGKNHPDYAASLNNFGELYRQQGNYAKAEVLFQQTLDIFEKALGKEDPNYAVVLNNLAFLCHKRGDYAKAELFYIEAIDICEKTVGKDHPDYASAVSNLGFLYEHIGSYAKAEVLYKQSISIREKVLGKNHRDYSLSLNNLGVLYDRQGNDAKAEPLLLQAVSSDEKALGRDHPDYAVSVHNLAMLYYAKEDLANAEPFLLAANKNLLQQIENYFPALSESEKEAFYKTIKVRFEIFNSFVLKRRIQNPAIVAEMYSNQLATKALLFSSSNKIRNNIQQSRNPALIQLYQSLLDKRNYLAKTFQMSLEEKQKTNINVAQLEEEINALEKQLSLQSEVFAREHGKKLYTWQAVQKTLKRDEAAIEMIRVCKYGVYNIVTDRSDVQLHRYPQYGLTDTVYYVALIVTPQSKLPELVLVENGNDLETRYIKGYKNSIQFKLNDTLSYGKFWKPIAEALKKNKKIKKIYLSPDGVYNSINLNTLQNPVTQKYVSEESDIQLVTNTKDLILRKGEIRKTNSARNASLFGYPDYSENDTTRIDFDKERSITLGNSPSDSIQRFFAGGKITRLPGTQLEISTISKLLSDNQVQTSQYLERLATEEEIKMLSYPAILHIATHGFFLEDIKTVEVSTFAGFDSKRFSENPLLRSGLLLAGSQKTVDGLLSPDTEDGILTAYEAMNLSLDDTELVVLSACETGLGEIKNGEGVYGLQRAFQTAGAKSVLMSLWKVDDNATQELMTLFYKNWLKSGNKREAFKQAQSSVKKKFKHPYYWGAFVLVGE